MQIAIGYQQKAWGCVSVQPTDHTRLVRQASSMTGPLEVAYATASTPRVQTPKALCDGPCRWNIWAMRNTLAPNTMAPSATSASPSLSRVPVTFQRMKPAISQTSMVVRRRAILNGMGIESQWAATKLIAPPPTRQAPMR